MKHGFLLNSLKLKGDERVLNGPHFYSYVYFRHSQTLLGFRDKARTDFTAGRSITNEEEYTAQLSHASEVAAFLRKNLIQGVNVDGSDTWSMCLSRHLSWLYRRAADAVCFRTTMAGRHRAGGQRYYQGRVTQEEHAASEGYKKNAASSMCFVAGSVQRSGSNVRPAPIHRPSALSLLPQASYVVYSGCLISILCPYAILRDTVFSLLDELDRPIEVSLAAHNTNAPPHSSWPLPPSSSPPSASLSSPELTTPVVDPRIVSGTPDTKEKPIKYLSKKALHAARNSRAIPELREEDLEEKFVQGAPAISLMSSLVTRAWRCLLGLKNLRLNNLNPNH